MLPRLPTDERQARRPCKFKWRLKYVHIFDCPNEHKLKGVRLDMMNFWMNEVELQTVNTPGELYLLRLSLRLRKNKSLWYSYSEELLTKTVHIFQPVAGTDFLAVWSGPCTVQSCLGSRFLWGCCEVCQCCHVTSGKGYRLPSFRLFT